MKKAIIVKNYNSVWGVQNRVEALVDWSMTGKQVPYDVDINGDNALITIDDSKRASYESDFAYNSDMQAFENILRDINDPLFKEDVVISTYNENTSTPDNIEVFKQSALESCSSLGIDILRGFGLDLPEVAEEVVIPQTSLSRAQEAAALADKLDQSIGNEALDFTVDHIPQYNSETDSFDDEEPLERPQEIGGETEEEEDLEDEEVVTPAEAVEAASEQPEEEEEEEPVTETVTVSKPDGSVGKIVDPRMEFIKEFMDALNKYDLTPESFVTCLMSIKALANNSAKAPSDVTPSDVTGAEDYSYTNAVPYVQNPNAKENPDVETQGMNVADGESNTEIGTEGILDSRLLRIFTGNKSKAVGEPVNNKEIEDIIKTLDKRIQTMIPRFNHAVDQLYREMPGMSRDYPNMFRTDYKLVRLGNKVQFRIIEVDTSDRNKHNITVFVIGLLCAGILGAAVGAMDPALAAPAGLGAGIGAANAMTTAHELEMNLATGAILDQPMMARLNAVTKNYKTGLISDYFGLEVEFYAPVGIGTEAMTADDLYSSLINEPIADTPVLEVPYVEEFTNIGLEALWAKHPKRKNDNQVIEDMKKICEDAKAIAKKALEELREKNAEIFEKYGAFVKILLDIKDIIFMDKHYVKLEVAKFELAKANKEVVPDTPNETVLHTLAGVAINTMTNSVLGPFASLATPKTDSPSNYLLAVANQLREVMMSELKYKIKENHGAITLVEDELKGNMVLTLAFKPLEPSTESEEEEISLIKQIAMESTSDDEFFNKVMDNFDKLDRSEVKETTKYNMWHFYRTGEKIPCDGALSGMRLCQFIKK